MRSLVGLSWIQIKNMKGVIVWWPSGLLWLVLLGSGGLDLFVVQSLTNMDPYHKLQSSHLKRTPQDSINEFIIRKLNPLVLVDFRFISVFLHA